MNSPCTRARLSLRTTRAPRHLTTQAPPPAIYHPLPALPSPPPAPQHNHAAPLAFPFGTAAAAAFPAQPGLFPRGHFSGIIPAWLGHGGSGVPGALAEALRGVRAPVEVTTGAYSRFSRGEVPLLMLLAHILQPTPSPARSPAAAAADDDDDDDAQVYLAQHALHAGHPLRGGPTTTTSPPPTTTANPTSSSSDPHLWLGRPRAARTPLHRDPQANVFVQLCGAKDIAVFAPSAAAQLPLPAGAAGAPRAVGLPEECMHGEARRAADRWVWGARGPSVGAGVLGYKARLGPGDGVFIPRGWWHALRGVEVEVEEEVGEEEERGGEARARGGGGGGGGSSICASVSTPTVPTVQRRLADWMLRGAGELVVLSVHIAPQNNTQVEIQ
ncbi:hypothetical protein EV426DRAFT_232355 [Tirmania nivea]|nr:hypothetical protein EV426DRAFT_232355 [Tirmania nivea]